MTRSMRAWRATRFREQGFTLVELMVVMVIIGILASIAIPAYSDYVRRSRAKTAGADLVALGLNFENDFQRTLAYTASTAEDTAAVKTLMPGWSPSQEQFFTYSVISDASTYTLTATGKSAMAGCTITLTHANARTATDFCGISSSW